MAGQIAPKLTMVRLRFSPHRPATPPMLVNRGLIDGDLELRERMIVEAFAGG